MGNWCKREKEEIKQNTKQNNHEETRNHVHSHVQTRSNNEREKKQNRVTQEKRKKERKRCLLSVCFCCHCQTMNGVRLQSHADLYQAGQQELCGRVVHNLREPAPLFPWKFSLISGCEAGTRPVQSAAVSVTSGGLNSALGATR